MVSRQRWWRMELSSLWVLYLFTMPRACTHSCYARCSKRSEPVLCHSRILLSAICYDWFRLCDPQQNHLPAKVSTSLLPIFTSEFNKYFSLPESFNGVLVLPYSIITYHNCFICLCGPVDFPDWLTMNVLINWHTFEPSKKFLPCVLCPASEPVVKSKSEKEKWKEMFPALCRADNPMTRVSHLYENILWRYVKLFLHPSTKEAAF